jgi:hypothetical protein
MVYPRRDGLLDGALAVMRFCNIYSDKRKQFIGITKPGLRFSLIENPVLDNNNFNKSLNEEESLFYINHVKENIIGEYAAMHWLVKQIENGNNERDPLNREIDKTYGEIWKATSAVINTQRAGLTSRMTELGLIERDKNGVRVKYRVSEFGRRLFLK